MSNTDSSKTRLCRSAAGYHPNGFGECGQPAQGEANGMPLCRSCFLVEAARLIDWKLWPTMSQWQGSDDRGAGTPTFTATIYVGFRSAQTDDPTFTLYTIDEARAVCQAYCNAVGLCVTLTPTEFIYTNGGEHGVVVGLINYPRFPSTPEAIRKHALTLGEKLRVKLGQWRVSVVMPNETVMLGDDNPREHNS